MTLTAGVVQATGPAPVSLPEEVASFSDREDRLQPAQKVAREIPQARVKGPAEALAPPMPARGLSASLPKKRKHLSWVHEAAGSPAEQRSARAATQEMEHAVKRDQWDRVASLVHHGATASFETFNQILLRRFDLIQPLLNNGPVVMEQGDPPFALEIIESLQGLLGDYCPRYDQTFDFPQEEAVLDLVEWMLDGGFDPLESFEAFGRPTNPLIRSMAWGGRIFYALADRVDNATLQTILDTRSFRAELCAKDRVKDLQYLANRGVPLYAHNLGAVDTPHFEIPRLDAYMRSRAQASDISGIERDILWNRLSRCLLASWDDKFLNYILANRERLGGAGVVDYLRNRLAQQAKVIDRLYTFQPATKAL